VFYLRFGVYYRPAGRAGLSGTGAKTLEQKPLNGIRPKADFDLSPLTETQTHRKHRRYAIALAEEREHPLPV
jgi:hypothetical protein